MRKALGNFGGIEFRNIAQIFGEIKTGLTDTSHSDKSRVTMPICSKFELRYLDTRISLSLFECNLKIGNLCDLLYIYM